jgi:hypothetical protein
MTDVSNQKTQAEHCVASIDDIRVGRYANIRNLLDATFPLFMWRREIQTY